MTGAPHLGSLFSMTLARARFHVFLFVATMVAMSLFAGGCGGLPEAGTPAGGSPDGGATATGYGVPQQGYPGWNERALLVLTNAVRLAPLDYRAKYASDFSPSIAAAHALEAYPAVGPLRSNLALDESARAHSLDMGTHNCFQHNSCDGTAWNVRIASYYSLSGTMGENIAAGYPAPADPRYAMSMWLCDASGGSCCADGASCDGHRRNMMSSGYQALGTGYANVAGSSYENYWTQDFGGAFDGGSPPLVDGSHILFPSGSLTFLANYVDASPPRSLVVVLEGSAVSMAVSLGTSSRGTRAATVAVGSGCRSYHFEAVDASGSPWRYPAAGEFRTHGERSCSEDWVQ